MWDTSRESGCVYFIVAEQVNRMKIGVAVDPVKRLNSHRGSSPVELTLWGFIKMQTWDAARMAEQRLHRSLRQYRIKGEWFEITKEVRDRMMEEIDPEALLGSTDWRNHSAEFHYLNQVFSGS